MVVKLSKGVRNFGIIGLVLAFVIVALGASGLKLGWLYFKNDSSIKLGNYKVEFPFLKWANYKESRFRYYVLNMDDKNNVKLAIFSKNSKYINIRDYILIEGCIDLKQKDIKSSSISGKMYICKRYKDNDLLFFQSDNKEIFFTGVGFKKANSEVINDYLSLIDSIKTSS